MKRGVHADYALLTAAMLLVCAGLIMIYSASAIWADQNFRGDTFYFVKRQLVWIGLGFGAMSIFSRLNYNRLKEWTWPALVVTAMALAAALSLPAFKGVHRWIQLGPLRIQPSEFAKLTCVLFLAHYLDRKRSRLDSPVRGFLLPCAVVSFFMILIGLGRDLGTPVLIFSVTLLVLFVGGGPLRYLGGSLLVAAPVVAVAIIRVPYRRARIAAFLSPWNDPSGGGYQIVQSLLAVGSGGWFGKGLGASQLKLLYLPTPHTDFIFPVLCEELGLSGALFLLALYATVLIRGLKIARLAPNLFGALLASGITFSLCLQAFFNIGMSIGLLPTKGIPLPFLSFGGSSLLSSMIGIGILLNISREAARHQRSLLATPTRAATASAAEEPSAALRP